MTNRLFYHRPHCVLRFCRNSLLAFLACSVCCCITATTTSCSSDDDPAASAPKGAPLQVMVVFSPGQLGDRGYADNVMTGIYQLKKIDEVTGTDSINVDFITCGDLGDTRDALSDWAATPVNAFYNSSYDRRLLVLTEPYMAQWLASLNATLRPVDEVLLFQVAEADVKRLAAQHKMEGRLHGLNIPASRSARRFATFVRQKVEEKKGSDRPYDLSSLPMLRLFKDDIVDYRDSLSEVLAQELTKDTEINSIALADTLSDDVYSSSQSALRLQTAVKWGRMMQSAYETDALAFCIVDLGAANQGFNYFLIGAPLDTFYTLMLDAEPLEALPQRLYIQRNFGNALAAWAMNWMRAPAATMPIQTDMPGLCTDNIDIDD